MKTCTPPKPSSLARVGRFVLGLAAGSLLAQTGWADSITLSPTADTRMISADANKNFGADNMMGIYMGRDRSLLQFDLSGIPAGQFIASATLSVYAHTEWGSNPAADPIEVYRVVTPWTELGVTWNSADGTTPWTAAGGDAVGTTQAPLANPFSVSTQSPGEGQPITWEVGSLVSEWYAGTTPNLGLLLVLGGAHSAGMHLWTKEQADPALHPTLTVQYSTSAVAPAITAQPQSRFAVIGNRVTFTATASGTAPVFYQWFKDGATLLSDQTNSVLTFPYVQLADAGSYSMTASNEAGVVASDSAGLMVFVADVAKGAAATQSSTDNGGVASRAVDGNTDGNWGSGSVTHTGNTPQDNEWWEVNLGTPTVIDRVQLWFRSDCCQVRNEDVRIFIYDTTNTATRQILWTQDVGPNPGATKGFDVIPSVLGQVVRVEHPPGIVQILSLAEVQVFTGDHVVAGPVAQSVSVQGGRSLALVVHFDLALDTFSATNLSNYVLAHGGPPTAAALQADGKSVLLSGINLNIGDSFSLDVSGINSVAGHPMSAPQTLTGTVGFYTVDWALSGTASQSSTGLGAVASRAIDGNNASDWGSATITHSADPPSEVDRWWEVDLGALQLVGRVSVWFRTDCCTERNTNFTVRILDDLRTEVASYHYPGNPGRTASFVSPIPLAARFVRWEPGTPLNTSFSLSEVEVVAPYAGVSIIVTQSPVTRVVAENSSPVVTVGAVVNNGPQSELQVQWQRTDGAGGFTNIPGATDLAYTNPPVTLADTALEFRAMCYLPGISVFSDVAVLTVVNDTIPPTLESVTFGLGSSGEYLLTLHFSELMDPSTLVEPFNYTSFNGVNIDTLTPGLDGKSVTLTLSGLPDQLGFYMLAVGGLYDLVFNAMDGVMVRGQFPMMDKGTVDVALTGTASQSTVDYGGVPSRAIDGNTSGNWGDLSVTHTTGAVPLPADSYWEVDLGSVQPIGGVHVWFRTDCCQQRDENLRVVIYDAADPATRQVVQIENVGPTPGNDKSFDITPPVQGRVVRVEHLPGIAEIISLAEVQVFAANLFPPLQLDMSVSGGNMTLSWPSTLNGFYLESTPQLQAPVWTAVPGVVNNSVTLPAGPNNGFFRLKSLY